MRRLLLAPLAAAVVITGCSTFDTDVVARVADAELTRDRLDDFVGALAPDAAAGDASVSRQVIGFWTRIEALRWRFDEDGREITEDDLSTAAENLADPANFPDFESLDDDLQSELTEWQAALNVLGDDIEYGQRAIATADVWVAPRYGQVAPDGSVIELALPTQQPTG